MGGSCQSKMGDAGVDTGSFNDGHPVAMTADKCWEGGGWKWLNQQVGQWEYNPNFPCDSMARCDGSQTGPVAIGGKACGKDNMEYICVASSQGGAWNASPYSCEEGSAGMCPTTCGGMTLCDGTKITKSKIGQVECGNNADGSITSTSSGVKGLKYECGKDGKWIVGGKDGKDTCDCKGICPDLKGCSGNVSRSKVGAQVCGDDRKMHICTANLTALPEWTYGKKCACPGDPPEPTPAAPSATTSAIPSAAAATSATTSSAPSAVPSAAPSTDNTMLIAAGGMLFLFLIIMVVIAMMISKKRAGGALPENPYPMGHLVEDGTR